MAFSRCLYLAVPRSAAAGSGARSNALPYLCRYVSVAPDCRLLRESSFFWAVWAISRFGYKQAGGTGALAGGLLAAALPIVLEMSIQARPYGIAWSFALLAAAAAATGRERSRALRAGVCLGVAVASRIDMVMVGPLVLLVLCLRLEG